MDHRFAHRGHDRGKLRENVGKGIGQPYGANRSEVIWEAADFEKVAVVASIEGAAPAAFTGLRRGDLVQLPWAAISEHAIVWKTNKSRGCKPATVPLLPETKALLARIKARHAAEMVKLPEDKRRPLPETVLSNTR